MIAVSQQMGKLNYFPIVFDLCSDELFVPNGQMVEVNGYNMHVYVEGEGDTTLVFMSGGGTSSPVLYFKSLYSLLSLWRLQHNILMLKLLAFKANLGVTRWIPGISESDAIEYGKLTEEEKEL